MKNIFGNKGISIVEMVLYIAIVGILLTAVVSFNMTLGNTSAKLGANIDTSRNRRVALNAIDYLVETADGMLKDTEGHCSDFDDSPPVLALYFSDDTDLPGTCVENGGGVRITVDEGRLAMTCYPNMNGNGHYKNCDTSTYPAGNTYYLTSSDVDVLNSSLSFSTSTATSTSNPYTSVTTILSVGTVSHGLISQSATSTASSTGVMYSERPDGLVSRWKFDGSDQTEVIDSHGNNNLICSGYPTVQQTELIDGGTYAFDFNVSESDYCYIDNPDNLNFSNAFTIAAWVKMDYVANGHQSIFYKSVYGDNQGYRLRVHYNTLNAYLRICDSTACPDTVTASGVIADATVYHITAVYDLDNDQAAIYVYQKGVGGISTTTASSIPTLVNTNTSNYPRVGDTFDGLIDDLRIYNRALEPEEIWALQSQGDY